MNASRPLYWILRDHTPVQIDDLYQWAMWCEKANRQIALDTIRQAEHDPVRVSTVFLGLDHQYGDGPPLLFETMVFGGPLDMETYRYPTWDAALSGHKVLLDEAVLEGKVSAWEVREQLAAINAKARADGD